MDSRPVAGYGTCLRGNDGGTVGQWIVQGWRASGSIVSGCWPMLRRVGNDKQLTGLAG